MTFCFLYLQRLSNGSIDPDSEVQRVIELQETIEKQNSDVTNFRSKNAELTSKVRELEESLNSAQKDLINSQEQVVKLQRDLREVLVYCTSVIVWVGWAKNLFFI